MALGSLKELYLDELADLYDAEQQKLLTLPRLAEAARHPELRAALLKQCTDARLHLERLELIFLHWGQQPHPQRCTGLAAIVQEADDRLHEPATDVAREAAIISAAHHITHYEIAAYGAARLYARWLNRPDDARLLEETLQDEARADQRLTEIADTRDDVNAA